ncbi:hypothetical protein Ocin01_18440 [Orchesella cincta]|uniref:Fibronectin type III domain-containing protein n=1 Tax=Orchesella cincta TaxID=48709 RepID=A0A1D2M5Q0_ORCCI|nr:hypothetical protein Ocin01_18440 [Orchesella cincta]
MAPSERSSPQNSRYLTSSEKKESPPGDGGLESEHFISDEEQWAHHRNDGESMAKLHDDESHNSKGDHRLPHQPRRTRRNKGTTSNNNSHSENNGASSNNGNYNGNNNGVPPNRPYHNGGVHPAHPPPHYPPYHHYPQPAGYPYYHDPHGQFVISNTTSSGVDVRGEEVGIVIVVLLLWVGAIILFFNRWGKIRMLEPYQPKFCENHRPSCPMAEVTATNQRGFSKFNLSTEMLASPHFVKCNYHGIPASDPIPGFSGLSTTMMPGGGLTIPGAGFPTGGSTGMLSNHRNSFMMNHHHHQHHQHRPRQNSVFVTSPSSQVSFYGSDTTLKNTSRRTKSAVDLPTLVLSGEFVDNVRRNSKSSITQL